MSLAYRISGLTLASDRPFEFLPPAPSDAVPDIELRCAALPDLVGGTPRGSFEVFSPSCVDLVRPGVLRVRIEDGCRLTLDLAEGASEGAIQTLVFGPAFAALLYQRGLPPLHAAAVRLADGGAVAVAGHSGAGKSTLACALVKAGHSLLSDDQIVLDPHTGMAQAGFPAFKLWRQSISHFGETPGAAPPVLDGVDKFHIEAPGAFDTTPSRLRAICILVRDDAAPVPMLTRLRIPEAIAALGKLSHHAYLADAIGRQADIFRFGAALAGSVPVFILTRRQDFGQLDAGVACVLAAAAG